MDRKDLHSGQIVHFGLRDHRQWVVDHPDPVNRAGNRTKGGRYVRLFRLNENGERVSYCTTRTASELVSHTDWKANVEKVDVQMIAEYGDGRLARQAAATSAFFEGMGMKDAVSVTRHTLANGTKLVTSWDVVPYRVKWKRLMAELGVIDPADFRDGD